MSDFKDQGDMDRVDAGSPPADVRLGGNIDAPKVVRPNPQGTGKHVIDFAEERGKAFAQNVRKQAEHLGERIDQGYAELVLEKASPGQEATIPTIEDGKLIGTRQLKVAYIQDNPQFGKIVWLDQGEGKPKIGMDLSEFMIWQARDIRELNEVLAGTPKLKGSREDDPRKAGIDWVSDASSAYNTGDTSKLTRNSNLRQKVEALIKG